MANVLFGVSRAEQLTDNLGALDLARNHGKEIRDAVDHLWLDRDVNPDGS